MRSSAVRPLALVGFILVVAAGFAGRALSADPSVPRLRGPGSTGVSVERALGRLPLTFRAEEGDRFVGLGPGHRITLSAQEALLGGGDARPSLRMRLVGAHADAAPTGYDPVPGRTNLLLGDDPARWRLDVPTYGRVGYRGVWDGVDVVYHGQGPRLEYDFVVAPGREPGIVELSFDGADGLRLTSEGDLVIELPGGQVRMARPVLYQEGGGPRRTVAGGFELRAPDRVGFRVGAYDPGRPLVIDPVLEDSTYLGGAGADSANAVAVDAAGHVYLTGYTESADFPTSGPQQRALAGSEGVPTDAFVAKLNPAGDGLVYSTFLGGKGRDVAYALAVGSDGSAYVAGDTESPDFPLARPVQKTFGGGTTDGFVARLGPQGAVLQFSTYLGGGGADSIRGIGLDQAGDAYLSGSTTSGNFPIAGAPLKNAQSRPDDADAFVTKINAVGSAWIYSTYLGGTGGERALAVAVDSQGHAYVTGDTRSFDFPVVTPLQAASGSPQGGPEGSDGFVAKLAPTGSSLVYSTYLGGGAVDQGTDIAVDESGSAYVTGTTGSENFPVARPLQATKNGDADAFVTKVSAAGSALVYSTYFGGGGSDSGAGIVVDGDGQASITGAVTSTDLPTVEAFQTKSAGGFLDGFVATLDAAGSGVVQSSYLGGRDSDQGLAVAVDGSGTVFVAGYTSSSDFPIAGTLQKAIGGGKSDAFVARIVSAQASAGEQPGAPGRERRIRFLLGTTVVLFLAAVVHTVWLRRRPAPDVPLPVPTPARAQGAAPPEAQAEWIAKAGQAVRPTGFPSLQTRRRPASIPARRPPRRAPVADAGPPTVEVPVPDLLADDQDGPGAEPSPPARVPDETVSPVGAASTSAGKARAVDPLEPDLLGPAEPESGADFPSDEAWWDLLIDAEATEATKARSAPPPAPPPAKAPVKAPATPPAKAPAPPPATPPAKAPATPPAPPPAPPPAKAPAPSPAKAPAPPPAPPPATPPAKAPAPSPAKAPAPPPAPPPAKAPAPPPAPPPATPAKPRVPTAPDEDWVVDLWAAEGPTAPPPVPDTKPAEPDAQPAEEEPAKAEEPTKPAAAEDDWAADLWAAGRKPEPAPPAAPAAPPGPTPPAAPPSPPPSPTASPPATDAPVTSPPPAAAPSAPAAPVNLPPPAPPMPPLDPDAAAALVEELSISDLLDEDLPIPAGAEGEAVELSISDLLDEDLPIPDRPPVPVLPGPPRPGPRPPNPPRPIPEAAPAAAPPGEPPLVEPSSPPPDILPTEDEESPSRPLPEAAPGRNRPERAWSRWRPRR